MTDDKAIAPLVDEPVRIVGWTPATDDVLDEAKAITVVADAADYEYAAGLVVGLKSTTRVVEAYYRPFKQAIDRLKRRVLDREASDAKVYADEAARVDKLARVWLQAKVDNERAEKDAADKALRDEQERLRQETVARMQRAAAAVPDANLKEAIAKEAAQLAAAPIATPKSTYVSEVPKVRGYVPSVTTYSAECTDLLALARAVVASADACDGRVPLDALQPNQARLNKAAVDSKEALAWPGVTVHKTEGSRTRG